MPKIQNGRTNFDYYCMCTKRNGQRFKSRHSENDAVIELKQVNHRLCNSSFVKPLIDPLVGTYVAKRNK